MKAAGALPAGIMCSAVAASLNAQRLLWTSPSYQTAEAHFYGALSHAACCDAAFLSNTDSMSSSDRPPPTTWNEGELPGELRTARWCGAEIARVRPGAEAAPTKPRSGLHARTLCHQRRQLAARFCAARGRFIADAYLGNARHGYLDGRQGR
jgi:hypothetical protein